MSLGAMSRCLVRTSQRLNKPLVYRTLSNMATAHTIHITPENTGLWKIQQDETAAKKVTELLQTDLEKHHVYFNEDGFHNHISHHLLSLFGTGASAEQLQKGYDVNTTYQRPSTRLHEKVVDELENWDAAKSRLGKGQYYNDFLAFFERQIEKLGWKQVLKEYMFNGDEKSEDMMVRMLSGVLHPLIQLMYGIEWDQPAMVAMGLAQACVHDEKIGKFLLEAEQVSKESSAPMPAIAILLDAARSNKKLATVSKKEIRNNTFKSVFAKAWDEIVEVAGRVKVKPEELEERTAEMYHTAIFEAAAPALAHPSKEPKFDFFLMHLVNVCPALITINSFDWVPLEDKVRLLEWLIRMDILQYAAAACPPLPLERLSSYVPKDKKAGPANDQLPRLFNLEEDGHAIKLFRAVRLGKTISEKYDDKGWIKIKGDMWEKLSHLVVDAVEAGGPRWIFCTGDPTTWDEVPDRRDTVNGVTEKLDQVHL
ncbi:hypothetical protein F5Y04DRAFT_264337 [Hypomontagnella monticulosa]|nr:hypothetical protein F5Y04DRAFT_264337 [Hypomontagnella monticulosa]